MAEQIEWGEGMVRATRDLSPDIRSIEIAPASGFVSPSPGSHINVGVMIGDRPDTSAPTRSSALAQMASIASRSSG